MQQHKELQSLLAKYAMQEPSAGFDDKIMQLVAASKIRQSTPLISKRLKHLLITIFILVTVMLLVTAFFIQSNVIVTEISFRLPSKVFVQLFSFFLSFWIVMLVNVWWNKRSVRIDVKAN